MSLLTQGAVALLLLAWTWRTWADVLVDSGRELYVPWQLVAGKLLYRDLAYFNGPLSPYFNALCFHVFGTSVQTLVGVNLVLLGLLLWLMNRVLTALGGHAAALVGGLVFLLLFAFAQYETISGYNYVFPYSHEMTHGLLLGLAALWMLHRYEQRPRPAPLAGAGLALGLALLTKPELSFAAIVAGFCGLAVLLRHAPWKGAAGVRPALLFTAGVLIPPVAATALLGHSLSWPDAALNSLGGWRFILSRELAALPFYRTVLGTEDVPAHVARMVVAGLVMAGMLLPALVAAWALRSKRGGTHGGAAIATLVYVGAPYAVRERIAWEYLLAPLPVVLAVCVLVCTRRVFRPAMSQPGQVPRVLALGLPVYALLLLAKMVLNAHLFHYGFVLAMPGTLLLVVLLVAWIPRWIERRGGSGAVFRAAGMAAIAVTCFMHVRVMTNIVEQKRVDVGTGPDRLRTDARGTIVKACLELLATEPPEQSLVVLPEGVTLNYFSRRTNPTPFVNFMPVELIMFGEQPVLRALERTPPDLIAIVHKDTEEIGPRFFGRDYGQALMRWVEANYERAARFGHEPLRDERFGIVLLRHKQTN